MKKILGSNFNIKEYKITLFFYQLNIVVKQYILLKPINNNLYQIFIQFFNQYQQLIQLLIFTNLEEKILYKNLRNFFFDFLLNQRLYKQTENFNLLINLNSLMDLLIQVIYNDIEIEEILNENIFEKILNFDFIFKLEDITENNQLNQKKKIKILYHTEKQR